MWPLSVDCLITNYSFPSLLRRQLTIVFEKLLYY